jgi:hypothetical protein
MVLRGIRAILTNALALDQLEHQRRQYLIVRWAELAPVGRRPLAA